MALRHTRDLTLHHILQVAAGMLQAQFNEASCGFVLLFLDRASLHAGGGLWFLSQDGLWELRSSNSPACHKTPTAGAGQEQADVIGTSCSRQPQAALGAAILHLSLLPYHPPDTALELWLPQLRLLPTSHVTGRSLVDDARFYPKFVFLYRTLFIEIADCLFLLHPHSQVCGC